MVIGITGSIASGKSLVSNYLKQKKYNIIDSDKISHEVLLKEEVIKQITICFGSEVLNNSKIDRKKLGNIIFNDANKKEQLQNIVFPFILAEIKNQISAHEGIIFLDAPLLFEYNIEYLVNKIIVVDVDRKTQIERLTKRDNISKEYALSKINSQLPLEIKKQKADFIIDNNKDENETLKQVDNILKLLEEK